MQTSNLDKCFKETECNIETWPKLVGHGRFSERETINMERMSGAIHRKRKGEEGTLHAGRLRYTKIPRWHRRWSMKCTWGIHEAGHWQKTRFMGREPGVGLGHEVSGVFAIYRGMILNGWLDTCIWSSKETSEPNVELDIKRLEMAIIHLMVMDGVA